MYTLIKLNQSTATGYEGFTFSSFQPKLQTLEAQESIVAIGASVIQQPIGLALAEIQEDGKTASLLSLFVNPRYRHLGIGTSLLIQLEKNANRKGLYKT